MWKFAVFLICLNGYCLAGPVGLKRNMPLKQQRNEGASMADAEPAANLDPNEMMIMSSLSLPSNATSIRADITDGFSCENKTYGYYADVENDCQIFHVCLPVTYADGKENTFRWSFICPEETIFSQDSFTCMRPDDMTIACEESYQYYELNRNFGIVDPAGEKESSNEAAAESNQPIPEAVVETEVARPVVQYEEEKVVGQYKPINMVKPSRRKPSTSYAPHRRPINSYPLRKIPQAHTPTQMIESSDNSEESSDYSKPVEKEDEENVEKEEAKPAVLKFSRRPVPVLSNSFKDKIQNIKTENVISTRTELFNQMRKRPTLFEKKPTEQPEEEEKEEEEKVQQPKIELEQKQHNFYPIPSDMQIPNSNTQVADAEIEASESNHVFIKPEEAIGAPQRVAAEPVQVLEAFEEIPAVISEVVSIPSADEENPKHEETLPIPNEKSSVANEPQITEEVHSDEEIQSDEDVDNAKETQPAQEAAVEIQPSLSSQIAESEVTKEAESAQETQPQTAEETAEVQQNIRTPVEENPKVDESQIDEETKTDESSEETESSYAAEETENVPEAEVPVETQVPEETQMADESENPEELKTVEESHISPESQATQDNPSAVETETVEQTQEAEPIQSAEQTQNAEQIQPTEQMQPAEQSEAAKQNEVFEGETSEALQSLRASAEEMQSSKETEPTDDQEISQTAEEIPASEEAEVLKEVSDVQTAEDTQAAHDMQHTEEIDKHEESISDAQTQQDDIPINETEGLVVEESLPVVHEIEESQISEEPASVEDSKQVEEKVQSEQISATKLDDLVSSEAEANNAVPAESIEQMESEKPADVPELMQSTEEMSHPDAVVQSMYENMDMGKQTAAGFKPVDPVMAHEAEQLIVDFINTLRKNDFTNETPGLHAEQQGNEVSEEAESDQNSQAEETAKVEIIEQMEEAAAKLEEQEHKDDIEAEFTDSRADAVEDNKEESAEKHDTEESKQETEEVNETNSLKSLETESLESMKESERPQESAAETMNFPQEMYQIPVQVVNTPAEEMPAEEEQSPESVAASAEVATNTEKRLEQEEEEAPAMAMAGHKPLSIDDIVELVKERLDHMPKKEMDTPMKLEEVIGEASEDKVHGENVGDQTLMQKEEPHQTSHSDEEIVMPIYQRMGQPMQVDAAVQTGDIEQVLIEEQPEASESVADVKEKTNRSYRLRRVTTPKKDSRKRRFHIKADSS